MAFRLVPNGQNFHGIPLEYPWKDRMGDNGGAGLHNPFVSDVRASEAEWYREPAQCQLGYGWTVCTYLSLHVPSMVGDGSGFENGRCSKLMMIMQTIHYLYRALLAPLVLNPTMSPIHITVWFCALCWQLCNVLCLGGWLASYGPTTSKEWEGRAEWIEVGMMIFGVGLLANIYHDDELREIRRAAARRQKREAEAKGEKGKGMKGIEKVYMIPENGLFRAVVYPHYFCEWLEWCGFWMIGGLGCVPARAFVMNEIATMLPRAVQGKRWYIARFGREKVGNRKAVIPGII